MASARKRAFGTTELLEQILLNLDARDLLVNIQRVSKKWKAVADKSPSIQKARFKRASSTSLTAARYDKNLLLAGILPTFFSCWYHSEGIFDVANPGKIDFSDSFKSRIDPRGRRPLWLDKTASWRGMHVAQPPITTLRWHVRRDGELYSDRGLPGITVEFNFPTGLRMGEYYDLILGTAIRRNSHNVFWPDRQNRHLSGIRGSDADNWRNKQRAAANYDRAILIEQHVSDDEPSVKVDNLCWGPTNLKKFDANLAKCERLEKGNEARGIPWSYERWYLGGEDRLIVMNMFLYGSQQSTSYRRRGGEDMRTYENDAWSHGDDTLPPVEDPWLCYRPRIR
ncbi:hypothetical protein F4818DRAFT_452919 [Hypoxylon cercidicola]|nr:hypothetical protein F4818DRAFT_452919 [Hypoxylon cercidicola]